jgi:hypothetical protein
MTQLKDGRNKEEEEKSTKKSQLGIPIQQVLLFSLTQKHFFSRVSFVVPIQRDRERGFQRLAFCEVKRR